MNGASDTEERYIYEIEDLHYYQNHKKIYFMEKLECLE